MHTSMIFGNINWWLSGKEYACQCRQDTQVCSLSGEVPLEKEMATHSSILAWEIPLSEEPRGYSSMGSQKSRTRLSY